MTARFNHTIIAATDPNEMAAFYRDILEAEVAPSWGPFVNVQLADAVLLQFATPPLEFPPQHYAYLVDDEHLTAPAQRSPRKNESTGPIRNRPAPARRTPNTVVEACTCSTRLGTTWS